MLILTDAVDSAVLSCGGDSSLCDISLCACVCGNLHAWRVNVSSVACLRARVSENNKLFVLFPPLA